MIYVNEYLTIERFYRNKWHGKMILKIIKLKLTAALILTKHDEKFRQEGLLALLEYEIQRRIPWEK